MLDPLGTQVKRIGTAVAIPPKKPTFEPRDHTQIKQAITLPDELWLAALECPCTFPTSVFNTVMLNLIKNPNITSSHLFRADIFYDSENDHSFHPDDADPYREGLVQHLQTDLQPVKSAWPDFRLERTIVRQLIPRNPQLDKPLVQTCHIFHQYGCNGDQSLERTLVLYIPHVLKLEGMPFYHPTVSQLAFLHTWKNTSVTSPSTPTADEPDKSPGTLTLLYRLFPDEQLTTKLERTALKLLQTIHKHGQGQLTGYEKRVHHDQLIPQKRYQDTYTRLKTKYGRYLSEKWVEVTDPGKHVFEDIGIAAYLIELWRDMYAAAPQQPHGSTSEKRNKQSKDLPPFPGFVDIGCGNALLTYILLSEGFPGSGFDARQRKTWSIFPQEVQSHLEQQILVPQIFQSLHHHKQQQQQQQQIDDPAAAAAAAIDKPSHWHSGIFPRAEPATEGPFIISNHADELTAWTPLLAYVNQASFLAIPCCSHDLSGARFRAPKVTCTARKQLAEKSWHKGTNTNTNTTTGDADCCFLSCRASREERLPQQQLSARGEGDDDDDDDDDEGEEEEEEGEREREQGDTIAGAERLHRNSFTLTQAAETGSLKKTLMQKKMASAYSTLCSYVTSVAEEMGFETESDVLRIPSTRNTCIVGRWRRSEMEEEAEERFDKVADLVARELKKDIAMVAADWIERAEKLTKKPSSGH